MRGYAAIGLHRPKTEANVGAAMRAAGCYGAALIVMSTRRIKVGGCCTDVHKVWRHMPVLKVEDLHDAIPHDCVPVAVDLVPGAVSLVDYVHPTRAFYVFGPEDGTLGKKVLDWCRDRVMIPTGVCMNLAATVNVVLYDRLAKGARS